MKGSDLSAIRHVAMDMDGTLYLGGTLFPFTPRFLEQLQELGVGRTFLTNNCSKSVEQYVANLARMGIAAQPEEIRTSGMCTLDYLHANLPEVRKLYMVATNSLREEFMRAGYTILGEDEEPDAVVVAFDTALTFEHLCKGAYWIKQGKPYIATHPDKVCPTDLPTVLVDCGSVCACLASATGRQPDVVMGKPHPMMLSGILAHEELKPHEMVLVGDRLNTDMAMARQAGVVGVLVLTGEATKADVEKCSQAPAMVLPDVGELGRLLANALAR